MNIGVHDGALYVKYYYENLNGEIFHIMQSHIWTIPNDEVFREYIFRFDYKNRKATIEAAGEIVWEFAAMNQHRIFWHQDDQLTLLDGHIQECATPYIKSMEITSKK